MVKDTYPNVQTINKLNLAELKQKAICFYDISSYLEIYVHIVSQISAYSASLNSTCQL